MAKQQMAFLTVFTEAFGRHFSGDISWTGGQRKTNIGQLQPDRQLRRGGKLQSNEAFELGDLRVDLGGHTIIIEFESDWVAVHNLVKYWPLIRGELTTKPVLPIVLCHFSNWASYGSYRDLWRWMEGRMATDPQRLVDFCGRQFDHGDQDHELRDQSITQAISWLVERVGATWKG